MSGGGGGLGGIEKGYYMFLSLQWEIHRETKGYLGIYNTVFKSSRAVMAAVKSGEWG